MADKVAKSAPELATKVAHGEVSLNEAVRIVENKPSPPKDKKKRSFVPEAPDGICTEMDAATADESRDNTIAELTAICEQQAEEIDALHDKRLIDQSVTDDAAKAEIEQTISDLRKELKVKTATLDAVQSQFQCLQTELADAKKAAIYWRNKYQRLEKENTKQVLEKQNGSNSSAVA